MSLAMRLLPLFIRKGQSEGSHDLHVTSVRHLVQDGDHSNQLALLVEDAGPAIAEEPIAVRTAWGPMTVAEQLTSSSSVR